jgi:polysaccharide biosynthesis/export protein
MSRTGFFAWCLTSALACSAWAQSPPPQPPPPTPEAATGPTAPEHPLQQLGPGDQVKMDVFGRPEMDTTTYIADDGTVRVPLAGAVAIAGLSPVQAAQKVEQALKDGQYLVDPHVTFTVLLVRSQRARVVGEVKVPGLYPIDSNTTVLDLLAQAGGGTEKAADVAYVLRTDASGNLQRYPVNLKGVMDSKDSTPAALQTLLAGDSLFVPTAQVFYIAGEVRLPAQYRIEAGMTLLQALARAGGVTDKGSTSRVQIRRRAPDGKYLVLHGKPGDLIQPDDVITVKERIF